MCKGLMLRFVCLFVCVCVCVCKEIIFMCKDLILRYLAAAHFQFELILALNLMNKYELICIRKSF